MKLKKVLSVLMVSAMFLTGCTSGNSGKHTGVNYKIGETHEGKKQKRKKA